MNIASFTKRLWGYIVDLIFSLIIPTGLLVLALLYAKHINDIPAFFVSLIFIAASWLSFTIIYAIWLKASNGRTLGNLIFGLRVVHNDVSKLTFGECLSRASMQGLIILVIINALYLLIAQTEKSIFDRVTNTLVVDWRNRSN